MTVLWNWLKRPILRSRRTYGATLWAALGVGAIIYLDRRNLVSAMWFAAFMLVVSFIFAWFESQKDFWRPRGSSEKQ